MRKSIDIHVIQSSNNYNNIVNYNYNIKTDCSPQNVTPLMQLILKTDTIIVFTCHKVLKSG